MTRREAAERVAKLRRLADGTSNPHEATNARAMADRLMAEHHLTPDDLASGERAAAFDDLVDEVKAFVLSNGKIEGLFDATKMISDSIDRIKSLKEEDKSKKLTQLVNAVRLTSIVAGDHPIVAEIKNIIDKTLKNRNIIV